jgi:Helix-turn-helix domain
MHSPAPRHAQESNRQHHVRDLFAWFRQVCRDPDLEKSDFKVAFVIGDHINRDGEAWPGLETIAEESAITKVTVIAAVRRLTDAGWLAVEPGRAGSGHSNRYRLTLKKVQRLHLLPEPKRYSQQPEKVQRTTVKGIAAIPEPLKNHCIEPQGAPNGARTEYVDRVDLTEPPELNPIGDDGPSPMDQLWYSCSGLHLNAPKTIEEDEQCKAIFIKAIDHGADPEVIIRAAGWCTNRAEPMKDWLLNERWKERRK